MQRPLSGLLLLILTLGIALAPGCLKDQTGPEPPRPPLTADWHANVEATVFSFAQYTGDPSGASAYNDVNPIGEENPYYVALPFNPRVYPGRNPLSTWNLKNQWVEIQNPGTGQSVFAQVEDVGPWFVNDHEYVFQPAVRPFAESAIGRPFTIYRDASGNRRIRNKAGIDLSADVAQRLGIPGKGLVDWRFVAADQVKPGPWLNRISTTTSHFRPGSPRNMFYERTGDK